jgi:hypothetical protein
VGVVVVVDAGLAGVEVGGWDPFGAAVFAFSGAAAGRVDESVVGWAGQGECVDIGGPTLVDGEAAAEAVVTAAEAERTAWASLPALAAHIDTLVGGLRAAAGLVGVSTKEQRQLL